MSKLEWDKTGERRFEAGVSKGVLYPQDANGTYPVGYAWNGLTSVSQSPDGADVTDFWADNIKYASMRSAENFKGSIEAYMCPPEFYEHDGSASPATGMRISQQARKPFGFCYRTEIGNDATGIDNQKYLLHLVYNATVSPSERSYETINDSPDAMTLSWEFDTTPVNITGHKPTAHIEIDSTLADPTKLAALEDALYGTANEDAYLPTPDEVVAMLA